MPRGTLPATSEPWDAREDVREIAIDEDRNKTGTLQGWLYAESGAAREGTDRGYCGPMLNSGLHPEKEEASVGVVTAPPLSPGWELSPKSNDLLRLGMFLSQ
jgi:hypothetical protein